MAGIQVDLQDNGRTLSGPNIGTGRYLNYPWLGDNCPRSWDAQTQDRVFDIKAVPVDIRAKTAQINGETLVIVWTDGAHLRRFPLAWLSAWLDAPGHVDPARTPFHIWHANADQDVPRFRFGDVQTDWAARTTYIRAMLQRGLAVVEYVPDTDEGVTRVANYSGIVRANFSGTYFNVCYFPTPSVSAYTAGTLQSHTDNPCEELPPGLQYLHCIRNEATDGESTFAHGAAAARDLKAQQPEDFEILSTVTVPFRYTHDAMDLRARHQIILTDAKGEVTGVTVSQHMADIFGLDQKVLDRFYPAFHRFLTMLRSDRYEIEFTLKSGDCVVFDNQRIVHGRRSFDPTSGIRILRGCYTDRGELRSRYRVLLRDSYIRDFTQQCAA